MKTPLTSRWPEVSGQQSEARGSAKVGKSDTGRDWRGDSRRGRRVSSSTPHRRDVASPGQSPPRDDLWRAVTAIAQAAHPAIWRLLLLVLLLAIAPASPSSAQNYSMDWYTIDGGGGTSTGGVYTVTGTIGQPDAGPVISGGPFTVTGGFWSGLVAIQTPGAPTLAIVQTNGTVRIWWPLPAEGWELYETSTLSGFAPPWTRIAPPYQTNATQVSITVSPPVGNRFYRLQKQ